MEKTAPKLEIEYELDAFALLNSVVAKRTFPQLDRVKKKLSVGRAKKKLANYETAEEKQEWQHILYLIFGLSFCINIPPNSNLFCKKNFSNLPLNVEKLVILVNSDPELRKLH